MSGVEVELRDGEIFTRGPNACVGFFADPDRTNATFEFANLRLDLRRLQCVVELETHGDNDLPRRQMYGENAIGVGDAVHLFGNSFDRIDDGLIGALADEQPLCLAREKRGGRGQQPAP